jgi:hypothetical protein
MDANGILVYTIYTIQEPNCQGTTLLQNLAPGSLNSKMRVNLGKPV